MKTGWKAIYGIFLVCILFLAAYACNDGGGNQPPAGSSSPSFAYVVNSRDGTISAFTINASTGTLTPVAGSPWGAGFLPTSVAVDMSGEFAFVTNTNGVIQYEILDDGALQPIFQGITGNDPVSVAVNPSVNFVYVANEVSDNVSAFTFDASGLSPVAGSPFPTGPGIAGSAPKSVAVDPSGQFVYVVNGGSAALVSVFAIETSSGALTPVSCLFCGTGNGPFSVAVDPSGSFVYVANSEDDNVSAYTIEASGALMPTPLDGMPFPAGNTPVSVAVDPPGQFVYVANSLSDNVSAFTIDASSGELTPVIGSPFTTGATGAGPLSVAVDPSGQFVYVANSGSASVLAFTIDTSTGALTPVSGSPFQVGNIPISVATTGTSQ